MAHPPPHRRLLVLGWGEGRGSGLSVGALLTDLWRLRRAVVRDFGLDALARACEGFVGAEIEQAVIDAMHTAFDDARREFTTEDILAALGNIVPLARSQREDIEYLRNWLREGRARSASFAERETAQAQEVKLDLG